MSVMRLSAVVAKGTTRVSALIDHPMEPGTRTDSRGMTIDANYITNITVKRADEVLLSADWGPGVSKNPYLSFDIPGGQVGEELLIEWTDNQNNSAAKTVVVKNEE